MHTSFSSFCLLYSRIHRAGGGGGGGEGRGGEGRGGEGRGGEGRGGEGRGGEGRGGEGRGGEGGERENMTQTHSNMDSNMHTSARCDHSGQELKLPWGTWLEAKCRYNIQHKPCC